MSGINASAQVGIGTTAPAAALEITSDNEGLLIPRVALTSTTQLSPINPATATASELVYNTATANDVTPGYYYLSTATGPWVRLSTGANATSGWNLAGNTGTNPTANFLGTADNQDLSIRTFGSEKIRVTSGGNVGIGTTAPASKFHLQGTAQEIAIFGSSADARYITFGNGASGNGGYMQMQTAAGLFNIGLHGIGNQLVLKNNSNIGIGTADAVEKLTVAGGNIGMDNQRVITAKNTAGIYENVLYGRWVNNATYLDGGTGGTYLRTNNGTVENQFLSTNGNVGIGSSTPQKKLHVNGSLQVTNELSLGGNAFTAGSAGSAGQYLRSNGPGAAPTWENLANVVPTSNGTVIAVNGQFLIAQEMIIQMSADYTLPAVGTAVPIGNLNVEIIDNENRYAGTAASNSFTVSANGVYQVILNMQLSGTANQNPVIGIWDDIAGNWIARVNDQHTATTSTSINGISILPLQTQTLITSVNMIAGRTYSFRIAVPSIAFTIKATSSGVTGSGPVSQVSLKRLR